MAGWGPEAAPPLGGQPLKGRKCTVTVEQRVWNWGLFWGVSISNRKVEEPSVSQDQERSSHLRMQKAVGSDQDPPQVLSSEGRKEAARPLSPVSSGASLGSTTRPVGY